LKLLVEERAAADIERIYAWIARDNPRAALRMVRRVERRILSLAGPGAAKIGRAGRELGTRELVLAPYVIIYDVDEARQQITVRAVFHGAQDR
jgi:toxin ParE1/3/4